MLPDFAALKRDLAERLARIARSATDGGALVGEIPSFRVHEGDRVVAHRLDGSVATVTFENPLSARVAILTDAARREGAAASLRAAREAGEQLTEEMEKRMIATISEAAASVGNIIDGRGRPFSADLYVELLETMELSFDDDDGAWSPPSLLGHPDFFERLRSEIEAIDRDPVMKARIQTIVDRKREDWRAREARRTLVD